MDGIPSDDTDTQTITQTNVRMCFQHAAASRSQTKHRNTHTDSEHKNTNLILHFLKNPTKLVARRLQNPSNRVDLCDVSPYFRGGRALQVRGVQRERCVVSVGTIAWVCGVRCIHELFLNCNTNSKQVHTSGGRGCTLPKNTACVFLELLAGGTFS